MRVGPATIGERDLAPLRAMHHVTVGENETVWRDDETRPAAGAFATTAPLAALANVYLHHRRTDLFRRAGDRIGIRVQQQPIRNRPVRRSISAKTGRAFRRRLTARRLVLAQHRQDRKSVV